MTLDLTAAVDPTDHVRGVSGGRQLVVYGDFECPYTAAATREIDHLFARGAAFEVVFRYFPLTDPARARRGRGRRAAARQAASGRCTTCCSPTRGSSSLTTWPVTRCSGSRPAAVQAAAVPRRWPGSDAMWRAASSGVDGTPSLFIDGRRYEGPRDAEASPRPSASRPTDGAQGFKPGT